MKQKIAIIDSVSARGGSHNLYLFGQSIGLINSGFDVRLFTNDLTQNPKIKGLEIKKFYKGIFGRRIKLIAGFLYIIGSIRSIIGAKNFGAKICHFHLFHVNILVCFDLIFSKIVGLKVVYTVHDVLSNLEKNKSSNRLTHFVLSKADSLITHNDFSKKQMLSLFRELSSDISVIPHGNYLPFISETKSKKISRKNLGISDDKKLILFFGMIKKIKGLEILLKSLPKVISSHPDLVLLIAGKTWENDFSFYQSVINKNKMQKHCIIYNKYIPSSEVSNYFGASDLLVLPYTRISQSGVLMMAMSYALPVLSSDLESFTEIIKDNETGFIFKNRDVNSLADKLISIFNNSSLLKKVSKNAMSLIKTDYNWNKIGGLAKSVYKFIDKKN